MSLKVKIIVDEPKESPFALKVTQPDGSYTLMKGGQGIEVEVAGFKGTMLSREFIGKAPVKA